MTPTNQEVEQKIEKRIEQLRKLNITEESNLNEQIRWFLSYQAPAFTGAQTIEIDEETAKEILKIKSVICKP